ncbi:helix-hairpin-helix domain-containing protein [Nonomuraea turcica]|uniref:helix-hairpin-helix domain-containing protein n=1 Tax=Nonomuraea sp. G32 TaxID=3067274 RepID=UPI00273AF6B5|nr:helix-hairpin-helix domain-containing protein [Nonomuraea sp. G32]MDP4503221.1 helix-hairpin-helix domain-containing protein [Nonomuraea sp. G32]
MSGEFHDAPPDDDLTRISGIGQATVRRLHESGIRTFADLAAQSSEHLAKILNDRGGLSVSQIDAWRARAMELVSEAGGDEGSAQHYESFIVRVLIDDAGAGVRTTTIEHVQTKEVMRWPSWDPAGVLAFVSARADLPSAGPVPVQREEALSDSEPTATIPALPPSPPPSPAPSSPVAPGRAAVSSPVASLLAGEGLEEVRASGTASQAPTSAAAVPAVPLLLELGASEVRAYTPIDFSIRLGLDALGERGKRLAYSAAVDAKPVGGGPRVLMARGDGLVSADLPTIRIVGDGVPAGTYRVHAAVTLRELGGTGPAEFAAFVDGGMLQVR